MTLKNKKFGVQQNQWAIPKEEGDAVIERIRKGKQSGRVLGLKQRKNCEYGDDLQIQRRGKKGKNSCDDLSDSQIWTRSKNDNEKFFTLKNKATGKFLTHKGSKIFPKNSDVTGKYPFKRD